MKLHVAVMMTAGIEIDEVPAGPDQEAGYNVRIFDMNMPSVSAFNLEENDAEIDKAAGAAILITMAEALNKHMRKRKSEPEEKPTLTLLPKPEDVQ